MKVQLVVVQGKPEGKVIPLVGQSFKIGRGETCHLRPNSEQVSREHAEFTINGESVVVRDLGSRNATLVNGKAITADACRLKDRDLVQVGPLTFAVAILGSVATSAKAASAPAPKSASPDDVSGDDIDSWLIGPNSEAVAKQPTAVYGGDTITISAFKDASSAAAKPAPPTAPTAHPSSVSDDEYERQNDDEALEEVDEPFDQEDDQGDEDEDLAAVQSSTGDEVPEEFLDPSNPFFAAKKALKEQAKAGPAKQAYTDTSDAASDILRRLMERRRAERS